MSNTNILLTVGRRKTSVARARLIAGKGNIYINKKESSDYFAGLPNLLSEIIKPLELTKTMDKYDIKINVNGGGTTGQAGAIRHAIARALAKANDADKIMLRKNGFLTRDSRMVERKKPGKPKARKSFQFSKR
ncbi:30S ribosomal protein S9 [bacterium]